MFSRSKYIVRMDDACHTMKVEIWEALENELERYGIVPIVGVVPDNLDPKLMCNPYDYKFWDKVKSWQDKGWCIALHGLHHSYHRYKDKKKSLIPLHDKSEFVGVDLDVQKQMIKKSIEIFHANGVYPTVFMAPSHSFDVNTISALRDVTDIRCITDGFFWGVRKINDFFWVPQQLWRFRNMPFGVWTICLHPNNMSFSDVEYFVSILAKENHRFLKSVNEYFLDVRNVNWLDRLFFKLYSNLLSVKVFLKN